MSESHYLWEIEDTGELIVSKMPLCNGVSLHERVHLFGTEKECREMELTILKKRRVPARLLPKPKKRKA